MIVTETQAENLECPIRDMMKCKGSKCMWWAWEGPAQQMRRIAGYQVAVVEQDRPTDVPLSWTWVPYDEHEGTAAHWVEDDASVQARRLGFCGAVRCP
jgi:hypothetical protein